MHGRLACIVEQLQFVIFGCVDSWDQCFLLTRLRRGRCFLQHRAKLGRAQVRKQIRHCASSACSVVPVLIRRVIAKLFALHRQLRDATNAISGDPNRNFDVRALAHVVRGILDLADLKFDADGRIA
jgi:hypothetical protein